MPTLSWWPLVAASLHIIEEFALPGGFAEWDRRYRPAFAASITTRLHVILNGLLLFGCLSVGSAGPTPAGVAGWLTLAALLASNGVFHLVGAARTRSYSPGMVTGLLLYIPMAVYGYAHFLSTRQASAGTALAAAAIGGSYHLWASRAHARRARSAARIVAYSGLALTLGFHASSVRAESTPDRAAAVIATFLGWAVEGSSLPADPPAPTPALPHRSCGGRLDPAHLPVTIYVSWGLSAEAQHASCNWKYDVASHRATQLTPAEAAEVGQRIVAGTIPPEQRAFFHAVKKPEDRLAVTAGYCWGSASGTFAFRAEGPVLIGALAIHGY
jgi:hypothetical protein